MQKQAFKNHYVEIQADNMMLARQAMFDHFGDKFVTVYDEKTFEGQADEFGLKCLVTIQVIDHAGLPEHSGQHNEYRSL